MASKGTGSPPAPVDPYAQGYDFLLANGDISEALYAEILKCVAGKVSPHKHVLFTLVTHGGQANAAYRIGRYLQTVYDDVVLFVPSLCKSAGTLVACASNRLLFGPFGEIGPLDVQIQQRDEIGGQRSGLTTRSALADMRKHAFDVFEHFMLEIKRKSRFAVSFKLASEISGRMTSEMMKPIFEQINPEALGQDFRDLSIANEYGSRLNRRFGNLARGGLHRLINDYPSHDFVIDFDEAGEIFQRVDLASNTCVKLLMERMDDFLIAKTSGQVVEMLTMKEQVLPVGKTGGQGVEKADASVKTDGNGKPPEGPGPAATAG